MVMFWIFLLQKVMVYIKLTPEAWTLSGLQKYIAEASIIKINEIRYVSYPDFKNAAQLIDQPIHSLVPRSHIISNIEMKKLHKLAEQTPQQRRAREELKARHELRMLNKYRNSSESYYFQKAGDESVKDLSKSISFGMTFIFSFFMAGLTGYYFGNYFLNLDQAKSMMVAIFFIILTIVVETGLFIIKQNRDDMQRRKVAKHENPLRMGPYAPNSKPRSQKIPEQTMGKKKKQ